MLIGHYSVLFVLSTSKLNGKDFAWALGNILVFIVSVDTEFWSFIYPSNVAYMCFEVSDM